MLFDKQLVQARIRKSRAQDDRIAAATLREGLNETFGHCPRSGRVNILHLADEHLVQVVEHQDGSCVGVSVPVQGVFPLLKGRFKLGDSLFDERGTVDVQRRTQ